MEVSLILGLMDNATLFEEVIRDASSDRIAFKVELDFEVFSKTGRIVVHNSFRISKSLEDGVTTGEGLEYLSSITVFTCSIWGLEPVTAEI